MKTSLAKYVPGSAIRLIGLLAAVATVWPTTQLTSSREATTAGVAMSMVQDPCGNPGNQIPCEGFSCGDDVLCPCPPDPGGSDCYYAWSNNCYNF